MKKTKSISLLLTLLGSFSCITNAREKNMKLEQKILANDEDAILSSAGRKYFDQGMQLQGEKKKEYNSADVKLSNANAGNYKRMTDMQKLAIYGGPLTALSTAYATYKVYKACKKERLADSAKDYTDATESLGFIYALDSIKSLICILDGLAYGQYQSDLDSQIELPPLSQAINIMGAGWSKKRWEDYGYMNKPFLNVVQRVAIHKDIKAPLTEIDVKNWLEMNNFADLSDDEFKKKWNNINIRYREVIKSACNSKWTQNEKPHIYEFIQKMTQDESTENLESSTVITKDGVFKGSKSTKTGAESIFKMLNV